MVINADKTLLVTLDGNGINGWSIDPAAWANALCKTVQRNFSEEEWVTFFPAEPYQDVCP
jgi:hypothetical protein